MIVIYTQENTIIRENADAARGDLISLYGEKLGAEAYAAVRNGRNGATYRKYGGPLVKVVSKEDAKSIRDKEKSNGIPVYFDFSKIEIKK